MGTFGCQVTAAVMTGDREAVFCQRHRDHDHHEAISRREGSAPQNCSSSSPIRNRRDRHCLDAELDRVEWERCRGIFRDLRDALRSVWADLEHIQHATISIEQRLAALAALVPLYLELDRAGVLVRREDPSDPNAVGLSRDGTGSMCVYLSDRIPHGTVTRAVECGPVTLDYGQCGRLVGLEVQSESEFGASSHDE